MKSWFASYLDWLSHSERGKKERDTTNNHAFCWALQAAEFARLASDDVARNEVYRRYQNILLPNQMDTNGSFPRELARTKPYSYSIFNFDVMAGLCQSLARPGSGSADLPPCRRPRAMQSCGVPLSIPKRQERMEVGKRCGAFRRAASSLARSTVLGHSLSGAEIHRSVEDVESRPDGQGDHSQLPDPPAASLGMTRQIVDGAAKMTV